MEEEKQVPNEASQPLEPNVPSNHGTNDEDQGGRVTIPTSAPATGDGD